MVCEKLAAPLAIDRSSFPSKSPFRAGVSSAVFQQLGVLPSLEVLPLFEEDLRLAAGTAFVPRSSYGCIARDMLTGMLDGGVLPWEIFIADVFARPGQRNCWKVPVFPHACPTELVLRPAVHKAFHSPARSVPGRIPKRLVIGVESQNSLTRKQLVEWLRTHGNPGSIELVFKFLPVDLMLQAMAAEVIDGFIAAAPWGAMAEETQVGILDRRFDPGKYAQQLVLACRGDSPFSEASATPLLSEEIAAARSRLADPARFQRAASQMAQGGKPHLPVESLERAARLYASRQTPHDSLADLPGVIEKLRHLEAFAALPAQIAATERTAELLLPR